MEVEGDVYGLGGGCGVVQGLELAIEFGGVREGFDVNFGGVR